MSGMVLAAVVAAVVFVLGLGVAFLRPTWLVERPRSVLAVVAAVSLAAAAGLVRLDPPGLRLDIDPASEPLISRDDPGRPGYLQAIRDFGSDDVYVVAMETDDVFTFANLTALRELTGALRVLPGVASVESLARVLAVRWDAERELVSIDRFVDEVPTDPGALADLRRRALSDPIYPKTLISSDGRTAAIDITFQPMDDSEFVALDLDGRIAALLQAAAVEGRRFYVAGRPHVRSQVYHIIVRDLVTLVPVAVAVAAGVLWAMTGSLWGMLVPLFACLLATLWVYGAMALLGVDVNLITLVLGPMLICIGSVYGVHFIARFEVIAAGYERASDAACATLRYARTPVMLAGLTTAIGFAALLLSDVPATNELGGFAIVGVAGVTWISLVAVPAVLALLPARSLGGRGGPVSAWFGDRLDRLLAAIARISVRRPNAVLAFWAVTVTLAVAAIPRIRIDTDFITFFRPSSVVRTDFAAVNRLLAGAVPIYVTLDAPSAGDFREPETLELIARLQTRIEALPGVNEVSSSVDLVRLVNRALHADDPAEARIPTTREAVAEATFLLPKDKLRRFTNSDHQRGNLIVRSGRSGSEAVRELEARIRDVLDHADLPPGFSAGVTGNTLLLNRSADEIAGNQALQVGLAATAILALIVGVFRAPRLALLAMVPNIAPVLIFFGVLGVGAAPLSIPTSLIGSIALGIAVDDTMHFLVAYRHARARGHAPAEAVERCVREVGRPIFMTSVMLVVGFLVILASGFATLQEFGALTALTMAICLSTDLLLFPALLVRLRA